MKITPKGFQKDAINNAVLVLSDCLENINRLNVKSEAYFGKRRQLITRKGSLLFEAPTGTGKTLMAGHTIKSLSQKHKVLWFWFAPYKGLIEQAKKSIRTDFPTLRSRLLSSERHIEDLSSGDVFVTTWASVAVSNKETRKIRKPSETMPSIDGLISYARAQGFKIGVVIDEAHHTFRKETMAHNFYKSVLDPELTILVTATPRDKDVKEFIQANNIEHLNRISISRQQGIKAGLIKKGVKVAVFKSQTNINSLIDFRKTALKCGIEAHNEIKSKLKSHDLTVTPLLLIQADSNSGSIDDIKRWLSDFGMPERKVRVHTSDEPDPHLMSIAYDEKVEVLIFKMAVATGFDVPRAFTLVSMRTNRDTDFGTQIVGRIMRVDKRIQFIKNLPESLYYGYVFLSDKESQSGLTTAAQRINSIKDELAPLTPKIDVIAIDDNLNFVNDDQLTFFSPVSESGDLTEEHRDQDNTFPGKQLSFSSLENPDINDDELPLFSQKILDELELSQEVSQESKYKDNRVNIYEVRTELEVPKRFKKAVVSLDTTSVLRDIVNRFKIDEKLLAITQQSATKILMEQVEIFEGKKDRPKEIQATLAQREIDKLAQKSLFDSDKDGMVDVRSLHKELEKRLYKEFENHGWEQMMNEVSVREGLHKILALKPKALQEAVQEALALHLELEEADILPNRIYSEIELDPSRFNIYGIYPEDLNRWERAFVEELDNDLTGVVKWWHRNPPRKPYSVSIPIPGQPNFYPDFIVGIEGRNRGKGILLVEIKNYINDEKRNAQSKVQAVHPEYQKVLMFYWEKEEKWMTVEFDEVLDKNILDRVLRNEHLQTY